MLNSVTKIRQDEISEKMREYYRKWHLNNKERRKERIRERLQIDPEFRKMRSEYNKRYRKRYAGKLKDYYNKNKEKIRIRSRNSAYRKKFGINIEEYNRMLVAQNGVCAICNMPEILLGNKHFSVDHCHKTGKVRGLLCGKCNSILGFVKDDIEILETAINYLKTNTGKC